jgi:hypothetical protein
MGKPHSALPTTRVPAGVTVCTHCSECDGALELAFELRPSSKRLRPVVLTCPYCGGQACMQTARRLLWVAEVDANANGREH